MAWRLLGAKPLSEPMLTYDRLDVWEKSPGNINRNSNIFIQDNAIKNVVCKMTAIFFAAC